MGDVYLRIVNNGYSLDKPFVAQVELIDGISVIASVEISSVERHIVHLIVHALNIELFNESSVAVVLIELANVIP